MSVGIEQDAHLLLGLDVGESGAARDRVGDGGHDVVSAEFEMHLHLLNPGS